MLGLRHESQARTANCDDIGELQSVDGYMNIALEKTQEFVNGVKRREYGDAFVRGNNGKSLELERPLNLQLKLTLASHVHFGRLMIYE